MSREPGNDDTYGPNNPRRSTRPRSLVKSYYPSYIPKNRVEKEAKNSRSGRSRTRSIARNINHYLIDDEEAFPTLMTMFKDNVRHLNFNAGIIRPPLRTEASQIGHFVVEMRHLEIQFLKELKGNLEMKNNPKLGPTLLVMKNSIEVLDWEMDKRNITPNDLPALDNPTNHFADISTWVIHFFDQLHDIPHRITDVLVRAEHAITNTEFKTLEEMEKKAYEKLEAYEEFVKTLKLQGQSKEEYKRVRTNIIEFCPSCNPKKK